MTGAGRLRVVVDRHEAAAAGWVAGSSERVGTVGAILPATFAAYARVLHPAYLTSGSRSRTVRWSELAGRGVEPSTRFEDLGAGETAALSPPLQGSMPPETIPALQDVLARHTRTPQQCWFGVWEGFSGVSVRHASPVRVVAPDRRYVLLRGELADAATNLDDAGFQVPNLWWPEDRAWLVATDIDHVSTYVAANESCVAELLATSRLEVVRVSVGDSIL